MKKIAIIPARYQSTRFPGKPLAILGNKTIIKHVFEAVKSTELFDTVIVATDNEKIFQEVINFGGEVIRTSENHMSGTDRIAEVVKTKFQLLDDNDIIVNVQGDEPFITKKPLQSLINVFDNPIIEVASLMHELSEISEINNSNNVKVVVDSNSNSLYFSRSPIPFNRDNTEVIYFKHIGVYAFRKRTLLQFVKLPISNLENIEKLEQLRLLENGIKIRMIVTDYTGLGIDTPDDLEKAKEILK